MKIKLKLAILLAFVVVLFILSMLIMPSIGRVNSDRIRIKNLNILREILIENNSTNLYQACKNKFASSSTATCSLKKYYKTKYNMDGAHWCDICRTEDNFNKYIRYKVLKCDNWWGIIELEANSKGRYFYLISYDGIIVKISKPILPEQQKSIFFKRISPIPENTPKLNLKKQD